MKRGLWLVRGLSVVGLVLGGMLLGFGSAVVTAPVAYAQTVGSIVVEGNRRVEAQTIRSYFKPGPGGRLGPLQIDEAYKALYATGLFQDVQIRTAGGRIVVTVVENPVINRIAFEGNSKVKDEQLKLEIQSKERGTLSRAVVQSDVQRIVEVYRRTGRFDVTVTPKIIELPNNRVDLVFEIKEGAKTTIKTIEFIGNKAYSSLSPAGRHQDEPDEYPVVPAEQQHLRPRSARGRSRVAAPLLPQARLHRRADRVGGGRIRSRRGPGSSSASRSRRASSIASEPWMCVSNVRALDPGAGAIAGAARPR